MSEAVRRALHKALAEREKAGLLRRLPTAPQGVDFCSNDYLGPGPRRAPAPPH